MKLTKKTLFEYLINEMFIEAGVNLTYSELLIQQDKFLVKNPDKHFNWFMNYKWSQDMQKCYFKRILPVVAKVLNIPKYKGNRSAEKHLNMFVLTYGLTHS